MTSSLDPDWTPTRRQTLVAALEQVLPLADEVCSGGIAPVEVAEATADYVVHVLSQSARETQRPFLLAMLDELQERAAEDYEACFSELEDGPRESLLRRLGGESDPYLSHAVGLLVQLGLEGMLGDPEHGGNPGGVGWAAVGLTPEGPRRRLNRSEP